MTPLLALLLAFPAVARSAPPRLLVVVSVDQMRADYFEKFGPELKFGLKRLWEEGFVYPYAEHAHLPTETAPGHAAILTGKAPREHGITGTDWWDRDHRREVTSAWDSVHGRGPEQLLSYTVGDMLKARRPAAKSICLAQKDRTAILLCGKKPDAVVWYDKVRGVLATSGYYGGLPAWVEAFDVQDLIRREWARTHPEAPAPPPAFANEVLYSPFADDLLFGLAERAIGELRLGEDDEPDLLALGFGHNDYAGHRWGPESGQLRASILNVDRLLGRLLELLEKRGKPFALLLTADHGIPPDPDRAEERARGYKRLKSKALDEALEAGLEARFPVPAGRRWVAFFRSPHVYLDRPLASTQGVALAALREEAARVLRRHPGVAAAYTAEELETGAAAGPFAQAMRRSFFPSRSGDVLFALDDKTQFDFEDGNAHSHGSPHPHDARVPLVWFGSGVRKGRAGAPAVIYDVAPTAAALLGVPFAKGLEGRVLVEALADR